MRSALSATLRIYRICFPAWTVVGIFFFTQGLVQKVALHDPSPWWHYLISWLTAVYICATFTPLIFWLGRRFPIERAHWFRRVTLHLLFSVLFSVAEIALHSIVIQGLGLFRTVVSGLAVAVGFLTVLAFHSNIMTYWTVLGISYVIRYYQQYQERRQQALRLELQASVLQSQLVGAQLSALNAQLQPHFLFNTLNAIMTLVRQGRAHEAEEMLARLSDLLRCVLEDVDAPEVPLRRELEYVRLYLSIQQVRFQDRLHVEIRVAQPILLDAAVPHLVLQPLVENAILHGIGQSSAAGKLLIQAAQVAGQLQLQVEDDGPGLPDQKSSPPPLFPSESRTRQGIGLSNTRARLRQLYGESAALALNNCQPCGAVATVTLPYRLLLEDATDELVELHALHSLDR